MPAHKLYKVFYCACTDGSSSCAWISMKQNALF